MNTIHRTERIHDRGWDEADRRESGPNTLTDARQFIQIRIGPHAFRAVLETDRAPRTCAAVRALFPLRARIIHVRWSGEALWIPGGDAYLDVDYENNTSHPAPGEVLVYPGGQSEMEILIAYGPTLFSSKAGQLSGNHFATILDSRAALREIGQDVLWNGAQDVVIDAE